MSSSIKIFPGQCHYHLEERLQLRHFSCPWLRLRRPNHCIHGVCWCRRRRNWFLLWGLWRTSCCTCPPKYIWVGVTFMQQMFTLNFRDSETEWTIVIGLMSLLVPPPGVANVPSMGTPLSTLMSSVSHKFNFAFFTNGSENIEKQDSNKIWLF